MTLLAVAITLVAGVAMGWINNVAGGAGVFAIWAFQYADGLPLAIANPTARVAAVAIGTFSCLGYLRAGQRVPRLAWLHGALAVPGALLGSQLALALPPWAFRVYLTALMLLLLWQQRHPIGSRPPTPPPPPWRAALGCLLIGAHMGFAQIGTGLVATLVLSSAYRRDLVAANAAKAAIVVLTSIASLGRFSAADVIDWPAGLWLAAGAAAGSYFASHWAVSKGSENVRRVVLAVAVLTLVEQAVQVAIEFTTTAAVPVRTPPTGR